MHVRSRASACAHALQRLLLSLLTLAPTPLTPSPSSSPYLPSHEQRHRDADANLDVAASLWPNIRQQIDQHSARPRRRLLELRGPTPARPPLNCSLIAD